MSRLPSRIVRLLLTTVAAAAAAVPALADEIVTKSGQKITGKILREDATHFTIDSDEIGSMKVPKTDIASVNGTYLVGQGAASEPTDEGKGDKPKTPGTTPPAGSPAPKDGADKGAGAKDPPPKGQGAKPDPKSDPKSDPKGGPKPKDPPARSPAAPESVDPAERAAQRRAMGIVRSTAPGKSDTQAAGSDATTGSGRAPTSAGGGRDPAAEPSGIAAAQLLAEPPGSVLLVIEQPRRFELAGTGTALGRRTVARLDLAGRASAKMAIVTNAGEERWLVRLTDVHRHLRLTSPSDRLRMFEGIDPGDWIRARLADGTVVQGRFSDLGRDRATVAVPQAAGPAKNQEIVLESIVQIDGLTSNAGQKRTLLALENREPVSIVTWPDGKELTGRVVDAGGDRVLLDTDGNGEPDVTVLADEPVADVRRVSSKWRDLVRDIPKDAFVRARLTETYPDATVVREWAGPVAAISAQAICITIEDGAVVLPYESLDLLTPCSAMTLGNARPVDPGSFRLPILPGAPKPTAAEARAVPGLSVLTDGRTVTHVTLCEPWSGDIAGIRLGQNVDETLSGCDLRFATDVTPRGPGAAERVRELTSETVVGVRVTLAVDATGSIRSIELSRR